MTKTGDLTIPKRPPLCCRTGEARERLIQYHAHHLRDELIDACRQRQYYTVLPFSGTKPRCFEVRHGGVMVLVEVSSRSVDAGFEVEFGVNGRVVKRDRVISTLFNEFDEPEESR